MLRTHSIYILVLEKLKDLWEINFRVQKTLLGHFPWTASQMGAFRQKQFCVYKCSELLFVFIKIFCTHYVGVWAFRNRVVLFFGCFDPSSNMDLFMKMNVFFWNFFDSPSSLPWELYGFWIPPVHKRFLCNLNAPNPIIHDYFIQGQGKK